MKKPIAFIVKNKFLFFVFLNTIIISACSPNDINPSPNVLTVTTATPTNITETSVTLGGNVTKDGGKTVTERGICLSEDVNPTIDDVNDVSFSMGAGLGAFSDDYNGFPPNSTVHVRAYAINSDGIAYGNDIIFTTLNGVACNIVNISANATISTPTTWTVGNVYVLDGIVKVTGTLTIEAGVVVKFKAAARLDIQSSGKIIALGTSTNRIVFTSIKDDEHCGDTNGDGSATAPQAGDWTCIYLNGSSTTTSINTFTYCDFLYAGANDNPYNNVVRVAINGTAFTFDHCVFAHTKSVLTNSASYAFYGEAYMIDNTVSVFTNNAFYDNDRPILLNSYYTLNTNNIFHNPLNSTEKNTRNGIFMYHYTNPSGAIVSWNVSEVPYVMDVFFNGGGSGATGTVNIGTNVIVKFKNTSAGISKGNTRFVNIGAGAVFTSYKDDTRGGDTNGDANTSSPANGDWDGYWNYSNGSYVSGSYIYYAAH